MQNTVKKCNQYKTEQIIRGLKAGLELFKTGDQNFLCYAVQHSVLPNETKEVTREYIMSLLEKYGTVTNWLTRSQTECRVSDEVNALRRPHKSLYKHPQIRAYRIAWAEHMIKELSQFLKEDWGIDLK